jgi:DNA repair photolyase
MGLYGGLKPADWEHWGEFTTFKSNAPELLRRTLRPDMTIYCSPLVDPYQPVEVIQTRGPLICRDLPELCAVARRTTLRVSFSLTTDREDIRRIYEPHCASVTERCRTIERLRSAGITTFATLAPILPCDPEKLASLALGCTDSDVIVDPFHVRAVKKQGATTRQAAVRISVKQAHSAWFDPAFQSAIVARIQDSVLSAGRRCAAGTEGFSWLAN